MNRSAVLCSVAAAAALVFSLAAPVSAVLGELTTPSVPFARDYPPEAREKVNTALVRSKGATFLGGHFLNSWTSLRYSGDTLALNHFLDALVRCPGVTVHVGFKKLNDGTDWRVGHSFHPNRFQVEVNLDSERVDIEKLYIPEYKGPSAKK